jgi:GntR family transcriptional regulator
MDEQHLYRRISETIRQEILTGRWKAGDRLPSVREMAEQWNCTVGTIQHAYQELAQQGLVTSRAGQGTRVVESLPPALNDIPLRRAALIHRAEAFLLEVLTSGYTLEEVDQAVRQAMDRWRSVERQAAPKGRENFAIFRKSRPGFNVVSQSFSRNCSRLHPAAQFHWQLRRVDRPGRRPGRHGRLSPLRRRMRLL